MDTRLVWLALGTFAIGAEGFAISGLLPSIAADTGATLTECGFLVLGYALAYAIGAPVLATLTGASDRRRVLTGAALVFAAGALLAGFAPDYGVLFAARLLMAFCAGLYSATAQATAVSISSVENRARAISVVVGGTTLAVAFGAPLGTLVAGFGGWRGTYLAIAVVGVLAAAALWFMLPRGLRGEKRTLRERLAVLAVPGVLPALATTLLFMTGPFAAIIYIAPLAMQGTGLDAALLPVVLLAFGIGAAIGNYAGGQAADRFGPRRTLVIATAISVLLLVGLSLIPQLPPAVAQPALIAFMVPWGIVGWSFLPPQVSRLVALAPNSAPLVLSLNGSALYLGTALGAVVGGQVLEHLSVYDIGWVGALFPLAALGILWATQPRRQFEPRLG